MPHSVRNASRRVRSRTAATPRALSIVWIGLTLCALPESSTAGIPLDSLGITVSGTSREFSYTNKQSAFFCGEAGAANGSPWQGFTVSGFTFIDDYALSVNGVPLDRREATTTIYPDYLQRTYPGGITEQLRPLDSVAAFTLVISSNSPVEVTFIPYFSEANGTDSFEIDSGRCGVSLARTRHLRRGNDENYPVWLSICGGKYRRLKRAERRGRLFSPVALSFPPAGTHWITLAVADLRTEADRIASTDTAALAAGFERRRSRMQRLLDDTDVQTSDVRFDKALAWAKLSLDALMMNQGAPGMFAGLPWFNNYWGRDTFISLPGAALVTGRFALARKILRTFADAQQTDSLTTDYGRIPNFIGPTGKAYNTADATPRFVMMAKEYIERSGDSVFMLEMYPDVLRSIDGTMKYHTDSLGFLLHGDAETWMDAAGSDGPWSPRGNRANDVQALWAEQLRAGIWFATRIGDPVSAGRWENELRRLKRNFPRRFIVGEALADHLTADGTREMEVRPNQLFCAPLLDDSMRARVTHEVFDQLTYRYGVASLSQNDPEFHPYHRNAPYYPKDAAYHNGTVWTWLQGSLITSLCRFEREDLAWDLTENGVHQILDRGAAGTMSELIDAIPRPGKREPELSGTFSQAWSLAEFIRNFYDDYLGVKVDRLAHTITVQPHLPKRLRIVRAVINLEGDMLNVETKRTHDNVSLTLRLTGTREPYTVRVTYPVAAHRVVTSVFTLPPHRTVGWTHDGGRTGLTTGGVNLPCRTQLERTKNLDRLLDPLRFVVPSIRPGLAALRGPEYPLISHSQIIATNPAATPLLDMDDPAGDDTSDFSYPLTPHIVPGSFDLRHFAVAFDSGNVYFTLRFRALSDPGWHPEYGFQLTVAAIAIHEAGSRRGAGRMIPFNARYPLDSAHAFERVVLVGGGVLVQDGRGTNLAAYIPAESDASRPFGDARSATIRFALPVALVGRPTPGWQFTVVTGAQDDHGGGGIGEFRTVSETAQEWSGGGKKRSDDPNIYDLLITPRR